MSKRTWKLIDWAMPVAAYYFTLYSVELAGYLQTYLSAAATGTVLVGVRVLYRLWKEKRAKPLI